MTGATFARPPAEGDRDELAVCAWSYGAGWDAAVEIGRATLTHLRDQLAAALDEIARRDAEDQADADALAEHVRQGTRGDTRSHLQVLHERGAHPHELAAAQTHHDRIWSTTPTTRRAAA